MKDINKLLADHRKLIEYEASKRAQFLSPYVVQAEAFKLAHEAAELLQLPSRGLAAPHFLLPCRRREGFWYQT